MASQALVAIDGSKFKAVNARDKNFTAGKIDKRQQQTQESIHRYPVALDTADRTQPAEFEVKTTRLKGKIEQLRQQVRVLDEVKVQVGAQPDGQLSKTDPDARSHVQELDEAHALPDAAAAKREHRDELGRARLQPKEVLYA